MEKLQVECYLTLFSIEKVCTDIIFVGTVIDNSYEPISAWNFDSYCQKLFTQLVFAV